MIIVEMSTAKDQSYKHSFGQSVWHLKGSEVVYFIIIFVYYYRQCF